MTNRVQIHEFYKKVNWMKFFIFQATVLKFGSVLEERKVVTNAKIQHNISKLKPAKPKKHRGMSC